MKSEDLVCKIEEYLNKKSLVERKATKERVYMMSECEKTSRIKKKLAAMRFAGYCGGALAKISPRLVKRFSDRFALNAIGTPLLSLDSSYQFLLTTEYLFWWNDCEGYGYLPLDNVVLVGEEDEDGVFATDKDESCGGFIVDEDITGAEKMRFIQDMNELISYIAAPE